MAEITQEPNVIPPVSAEWKIRISRHIMITAGW